VRLASLIASGLLLVAPGGAHGRQPGAVLVVGSAPPPVMAATLRELSAARVTAVELGLQEAAARAAQRLQQKQRALVGRVEAAIDRARDLFYGVRLSDAEGLLAATLEQDSVALAVSGRLDLLRRLQVWRGVCLAQAGRDGQAREAFAAARLIDGALDQTSLPPRVVRIYRQAVRQVEHRPRGALVLRVRPSSAVVTVDGRPGPSAVVRLPYGDHWVVAEALGYRPTARRVHLDDVEVSVDLDLPLAAPEELRVQLDALYSRRQLDLTRPQLVQLLGRAYGATEVLLVEQGGQRRSLIFTRYRCLDGRVAGRSEVRTAAAEVQAAVRAAMSDLWLLPSGAPRPRPPIYKRWWFWTSLGVVAGGVAAAVIATQVGGGPDTYTLRLRPR